MEFTLPKEIHKKQIQSDLTTNSGTPGQLKLFREKDSTKLLNSAGGPNKKSCLKVEKPINRKINTPFIWINQDGTL